MDGNRRQPFSLIFLILVAVMIAGVIAFGGSEGFSQSAATVIAIAKMDVGAAPADFKFGRTGQGGQGQWKVVSDPTSFSGRVIEQTSTDRTDYRFPLAIFESVAAKNVAVSVRFKPVAGALIRPVALPSVSSMPTTITSCAQTRSKTMFAFTASLRAVGSKFTGSIPKSPEMSGTRSGSKRRASGSPLSSTAKRCSRAPIRPSPAREKLRFGQSLTASRASIRSRSVYWSSGSDADDIQHETTFLRPGADQGNV